MGNPIDNKNFIDNYRYVYQNPNIRVSHNPHAAPQTPFDINAAEGANKAKKDVKKDKENKKKDKNGKDIEEDDEDKPLPRPMGL